MRALTSWETVVMLGSTIFPLGNWKVEAGKNRVFIPWISCIYEFRMVILYSELAISSIGFKTFLKVN